MEGKTCYSLTTRCFTLRCSHPEWLESTQLFYNQILLFYYNLFLDLVEMREENAANNGSEKAGKSIASLNSQQLLRELERRTVVGRNKEPVDHPLPWSRIPLYFRRAAANAGIAAGRSFLNREEQKQRTECFHEAVTYYKGTYREFEKAGITLKVWTGMEWKWMRCRLSGNKFISTDALPTDKNSANTQLLDKMPVTDQPESASKRTDFLSPSVVLKSGGMFLHVQIRERVENGSNARTRMAEGTNLCCVQFTNGDSIAVCAVLDREGNLTAARFLKGGGQYRHSCKAVQDKIEKSKASTVGQEKLKANQKYWLRLQNLSMGTSHQISRKIADFAKQKNCGIIVLPKYDEQYSKIVMKTVGNWSPLHLSSRIRSQLSYKAWQQGILVLEVNAGDTSGKCFRCGEPIIKDGEECRCTNAHRVSRHVNTAVNLGRKCQEGFNR